MDLIRRALNAPRDLKLLLSNPTSFFVALLLIGQICTAAVFSLTFPFFLRYLVLPNSIIHRIPLNMVFSTCENELSGVCSFPFADVHYEPNTLFNSDVHYAISVRLRFIDNEHHKMGMFQNMLRLSGYDKNAVEVYSKIAYARTPTIFTKIMWLTFFPLYIIGFFDDYRSVDVLLAKQHLESFDIISNHMHFEVQNRFAQIESAELMVHAQFGLLRSILYSWPLISYIAIFTGCLVFSILLIFLYWGARSWQYLSGEEECEGSVGFCDDAENERSIPLDRVKKADGGVQSMVYNRSRKSYKEKPSSMSANTKIEGLRKPEQGTLKKQLPLPKAKIDDKEHIPDNMDELPECVTLSGIPGWDPETTVPDEPISTVGKEVDSEVRYRKKYDKA